MSQSTKRKFKKAKNLLLGKSQVPILLKTKISNVAIFSEAKFPDFGIEYDCSSIMHYQDYFFGKRKGAKTIIPKNSEVISSTIFKLSNSFFRLVTTWEAN